MYIIIHYVGLLTLQMSHSISSVRIPRTLSLSPVVILPCAATVLTGQIKRCPHCRVNVCPRSRLSLARFVASQAIALLWVGRLIWK